MAADVIAPPGDAVYVRLAPPVFVEITETSIVLFDGGDAGRVLWRAPQNPGEREITRALQTPGP